MRLELRSVPVAQAEFGDQTRVAGGRLTVAREVCALVQLKGMKLQQAADEVIHKELEALHGDGGVIAVAPDGEMAWSFNTSGMFRARQAEGGKPEIHIYKDER